MRRPGIHIRLLFAVFVLITATTVALGAIGVNIIHEFVQARFEERIRFLARYLALNAELGILIDDKPMLERLAKNLLSEKDVAGVRISNPDGKTLAQVSQPLAGPITHIQAPVRLKESWEESLAFRWNGQTREKTVGQVTIWYSTREINRLLKTMKLRFMWLAVGLALLFLGVFYFISRSLVAPISRLARTARAVGEGRTELRARPENLPETREMALAFNAMLDSLERSTQALKAANQEVIRQKTLAEMGKFSLMIAHEFKNPLGILKSSLDILKKDIEGDPMLIEYMEDEILRLNRLIEDFLMFARPAKPSPRSTDLHGMLKECAARFDLQLPESLTLEVDIPETPCTGEADPDLLVRAISNILKNAREAVSEQTGTIRVFATMENGNWVAAIADSGPGIEPEHKEKIFEPFFTTRSKGTGLGLAFAAQVVRGHGGSIAAENRNHGGAVFRITLPLSRQP